MKINTAHILFTIYLSVFDFVETSEIKQCTKINKISNFDGEFILTGLVPVLTSVPSRFRNIGLLFAEAIIFAVDEVNESILENKQRLGYEIFDTCGEGQIHIVSKVITDLLLNNYEHNKTYANSLSCKCEGISNKFVHIGILGSYSSTNSIQVSELLSDEDMPVLSYISTSAKLSNNNLYPNFFRTIPPDDVFAKVIVDVILHYNWSYVSLIASDNTYGFDGHIALLYSFKKHNICTNINELFTVPYNYNQMKEIMKKFAFKHNAINEPPANVVVIFAVEEAAHIFLRLAEQEKLYGITWILTDATGISQWIGTISQQVVSGLFTIAHYAGKYQKFEKYFLDLSFKSKHDNHWLSQFFHINNGTYMDDFKHMFKSSFLYVTFIRNAVYAYATALKNYIDENELCFDFNNYNNCSAQGIFNRTLFLEKYFRFVTFSGLTNEMVKFNLYGDVGTALFIVYNVHIVKNAPMLRKIGNWSSISGLQITEKVTWPLGSYGPPISQCSEKCRPGFYPIINVGKRCCWICLQCPQGSIKPKYGNSDCVPCSEGITNENQTMCVFFKRLYAHDFALVVYVQYVLVIFAVLTSVCVLITFWMFKETPVVKACNFRLSLIHVTVQMTLFVTLWLFILDVNRIRCLGRIFLVGLQITFIITTMLVKSEQLLRAFKSEILITVQDVYATNAIGAFLLFCTVSLDLCLLSILLIIDKIELAQVYHWHNHTKEVSCNISRFIYVQSGYIVFLSLICAVQAFRCRNLPNKFNQARHILYSVLVMLLFCGLLIPLRCSASTEYGKSTVLFGVVYGENFSILSIMYGTKVWIIWRKPEKNKLEIYKKSVFASVMKDATKKISEERMIELA